MSFKLYDRLLLALPVCLWTRIFPGLCKEVSFLSFPSCSLYLNLSKGVDYSFYISVPLLWRCLGKTALSSHGIICSDDKWCPDCNLSVVCVNSICVCMLSAVIHKCSALLCSLPAWNCLSGVTLIFWALLSHTVSQYRVMVSECVPQLPQVPLETELIMPFPSTLSVTVV